MNDKLTTLMKLADWGFKTPTHAIIKGHELTDTVLGEMIAVRRIDSEYDIDGVVVDVNNAAKRASMVHAKDTLNPKYSIKYKVADTTNIGVSVVTNVEFRPSKHMYLKPVIHFEPIELMGVTISKCTGFNAKFIYDNRIQPGTVISITRSGDVIPFCKGVVTNVPNDDYHTWFSDNIRSQHDGFIWVLNDKGDAVDVKLKTSTEEVVIKQIADFFTLLDIPHLREKSIAKLYAAGFTSVESIIKCPKANMAAVLGANGDKAFVGLHAALANIPLYKLIGAYSNARGLGIKRFKKIQQHIGIQHMLSASVRDIVSIPGFDTKTAVRASVVLEGFNKFLADIKPYVTFESSSRSTTSNSMDGQRVCLTGFRDANLQEQIEQAGGEVQSGVSKHTTLVVAIDPNGTSEKLKKARSLGITIVSRDQLSAMFTSQ